MSGGASPVREPCPYVEATEEEKLPIYQIAKVKAANVLSQYKPDDEQGGPSAMEHAAASTTRQRPSTRAPMTPPSSRYIKSSHRRQPSLSLTCPTCGSAMVYTPRRVIDRLLHWIHPVLRYRCTGFKCGYEGNRRSPKMDGPRPR